MKYERRSLGSLGLRRGNKAGDMMGHHGDTDRVDEVGGRERGGGFGFDGLWLLCIRAEWRKGEELRWEGRRGRLGGGEGKARRAKHIRLCHQLNWIFVLSISLSPSPSRARLGGGGSQGWGTRARACRQTRYILKKRRFLERGT